MHYNLLVILVLLFVVILLVLLAKHLKIAYPILLVIAGLGISFIPGVPKFHLDPELIFLIFLPPLLYEAAWYTSWKDFWKWKLPITLLAFGLVFFTSSIVAYVAYSYIPGFTLALGFLLGGIVSPPDAVAATTVLKGINVPKRFLVILEGESLVNDASSLIVFKFALLAVFTGTFSIQNATEQFFIMAGMGAFVGVLGAVIMYCIHRFLPTTPAIDATLTVMTPYLLFLFAEYFDFSGVLAVVSGGLFMSYRSLEIFKTGSTRLNMLGVWTTMIFVMNTLVFILIGLELPDIISGLSTLSIFQAIKYGVIISIIVIVLRFLWVYPVTHISRWLSSKSRKTPSPGWKGLLVISLAGMRGVVSLATALSIPVLMTDGTKFPERNLIIFITFVVIFITLVFQGVILPFVINFIQLKEIDKIIPEEEQQVNIQIHLNDVALKILKEKYALFIDKNELVRTYMTNLENEIINGHQQLDSFEYYKTKQVEIQQYHKMLLHIYSLQRKKLFNLRQSEYYSDEEIRKAELQLDLNELKMSSSKE